VSFEGAIEDVGKAVDVAGVGVIVVGIVLAAAFSVVRRSGAEGTDRYRQLRQRVGRAILLGLEILVAADIIRTVAVEPNFTNAGVLAVIVLIRTLLSMSLEVELTGTWPWRNGGAERA
jgi:uncharacterized membrane protein